jgi:hypothetical protein
VGTIPGAERGPVASDSYTPGKRTLCCWITEIKILRVETSLNCFRRLSADCAAKVSGASTDQIALRLELEPDLHPPMPVTDEQLKGVNSHDSNASNSGG